MTSKRIGYILLFLGILIIGYSAFDVYQVFTKQKQPIQLFSLEGIFIDPSTFAPQIEVPAGMESIVRQPARGGQIEILPADLLNLTSNLFAHILLMGFIGSVGSKIATLGTALVRTIEVKVRTHETPQA